ncbi:MAG: rhodanese-like domain-containing protein [Chitinophagales bacterium]|nr:rhodanese-like domain-containing protein [Hyphomicrobiales bacterium]
MISVFRSILGLGAISVFAAIVIGLAWFYTGANSLDPTNPAITFADIERTVEPNYAAPQILADEPEARIASDDTIIFDVRERAEFEHSHIKGAVYLPPGTGEEEFAVKYAKEVNGKTVVFYCAVGVRSSIMHNRVNNVLQQNGSASAYNLGGGIFRWHAGANSLSLIIMQWISSIHTMRNGPRF